MRTSSLLAASLVLVFAGCGGGDDEDGIDAAATVDAAATIDAAPTIDSPPGTIDAEPAADALADHTENNGGTLHKPGKADPLTNCVSCHGADLTGGVGTSCYTCHNNNDHDINRGGQMHLGGSSSTCNACHGPSNSGGLGPACNSGGCH